MSSARLMTYWERATRSVWHGGFSTLFLHRAYTHTRCQHCVSAGPCMETGIKDQMSELTPSCNDA